MDFASFFSPEAIAVNWTSASAAQPAPLGAGLWPAKKRAGLELSWIKGHKGLPISLMPSTFDSKATYYDREGFTDVKMELPFFRAGYKIKEKDRQIMLEIQNSTNARAAEVIANIFDDYRNLIDSANVVPERMRMQLLFPQDGDMKIAIKANGVAYEYNYDTDGSWKTNNYTALTTNDLWTATTTADPFASIKAVSDAVRAKTGSVITTAVMSSATFNLLGKVDAVKNRFLTTNGMSFGYLTDNEVKQVFAATSGINILVYDAMYRDEDKAAQSYVPYGYVALLPSGPLGSTWYGTTPEEADLMGKPGASVAIVNTGVAISQEIIPHPVNINTFASEIVLPSYERMDECACLKVIA